jgi:hypothetical protein
LTAFWTIFLEGNIAAPPTITVFSSALAGAMMVAVKASALKAAADSSAIRLDMESSPEDCDGRRVIRRCENNDAKSIDRVDFVVVGPSYGRFFGRFRGINYRDV